MYTDLFVLLCIYNNINFYHPNNFRDLSEILSRALDNVGRVYAVMGDFTNAAK